MIDKILKIPVAIAFESPKISQHALLDAIEPRNSFSGHTMRTNQISWTNLKYCIRLASKPGLSIEETAKLVMICFGIEPDKTELFYQAPIYEYYQAKKFIELEFVRVTETEARALSTPSIDAHLWEAAGANNLKQFADTLPLIQLGKLFGVYPQDLGRKPYGEVFSLLVQLKMQNDVEAAYSKLISKK